MIAVQAAHVVSTLFMAAVIWFVQVVHYPLFAKVGAGAFVGYEAAHVRRITWIVMPAMLIELASAVSLVAVETPHLRPAEAWVGLALVALVWGSTGLLQVPLHSQLAGGLDAGVVSRLVASNWIRTVGWTLRAGLACVVLVRALR